MDRQLALELRFVDALGAAAGHAGAEHLIGDLDLIAAQLGRVADELGKHGIGARAHEPPYAHQAGGGTVEEHMVLAIEPGCYLEGGGGLRLEDNFLITATGAEKLSSFPDGVVSAA